MFKIIVYIFKFFSAIYQLARRTIQPGLSKSDADKLMSALKDKRNKED